MCVIVIQQAGFAVGSIIDPLAAALWMAVFGGLLLALSVRATGSLGVRQFDTAMWVPTLQTGFSNSVTAVAYVIAVAELGLGVTAAIVALGPLSVGFLGILKCLRDKEHPARQEWAREQIALRFVAFGGVVLVNRPWKWLENFTTDTLIGLVAAVASAVCFWNYINCVFGMMDETKTKGGLAVANLIAVPLTIFAVWLAGKFMGGGMEVAFSPDVIVIGLVAGLLALTIPALLQDLATGKVSERVTGVLYLLDSPIAAGIGAVGVLLGILSETQSTDIWVWSGIAIVVSAALRVTLKGDEPRGGKLGA
ncbi:hypothetical protein GWI34_03395 [Actinomadura sp. DSM 109109]|nr:hypothetical protein [Actinomadura lepetitiana]